MNLSWSDSRLSVVGSVGVGAKVRPLARSFNPFRDRIYRVWLLRFTTYLLLRFLEVELRFAK